MKILVVEDQLFVQNAITDMLFETRKDVQVDFLTSPYEAIEYLAGMKSINNQYDIVVSDLQFENGDKSFLVIEYCSRHNIPSIVFSMFENAFLIKKAFEHGALGYISKYDEAKNIIDGFNILFDGEKSMRYTCLQTTCSNG